MSGRYLVILTRRGIDRFEHNRMFAIELSAAFSARGWSAKTLDYIDDSKAVFAALRDDQCKFFVLFNGFGTEIEMPTIYSGRLESAFKAFGKPVFDLMHDAPMHESMVHQLHRNFEERRVFITDYCYAQMASELDIRNIVVCPSITFPENGKTIGPAGGRSVQILLAAGFLSPSYVADRYDASDIRSRLYRNVFEEVTAACASDWTINPSAMLFQTFRNLGIRFDGFNIDHRFVLTTILDFVKLERRAKILASLKGLPLTLVADRQVDADKLWPEVTVLPPCSAIELLALMKKSEIVVCPTTHVSGFHERPLGAFSMQAAVVSSPCIPLQTAFVDGEEAFFSNNSETLRMTVEKLLGDQAFSRRVGIKGFEKANSLFRPERLIDTMLNFVS